MSQCRSSCSPLSSSCFKKSEAAVSRCFSKEVFLKIPQYSEENICVGVSFNKVACLQLSREYCKILKNSLFHKTLGAASEKFINFPGKLQWRGRNRFIFLINTTE